MAVVLEESVLVLGAGDVAGASLWLTGTPVTVRGKSCSRRTCRRKCGRCEAEAVVVVAAWRGGQHIAPACPGRALITLLSSTLIL